MALLLAAALPTAPVHAGKLVWPKPAGPFEACLETAAEEWIGTQAERVVIGDERTKQLDDTAVAAWTVEALKACTAKGAAAAPDSDDVFGKYMAHWRQHLYDQAAVIRSKGGVD